MVLNGYRQTAATLLLGFAIGLGPCAAMADAIISLTGPTSNAGDIDLTTADGNYGGEMTIGGTTGYSLWGLLGGAKPANPNSPIYGAITTSTPSGLNGKNAILRYYLLATSTSGARSLISLGEIDPQFSGGPSELVTVTGDTASLVFTNPAASGRNVGNLASLQLLSAPALTGSGGQSAAVTLKGNVGQPGAYTLSDLEGHPSLNETVNGHAYTGVPFSTSSTGAIPTSSTNTSSPREPTATRSSCPWPSSTRHWAPRPRPARSISSPTPTPPFPRIFRATAWRARSCRGTKILPMAAGCRTST
ncbi:MAG TPA: hypothetical protein VGF34_09875 [Stellaceae bacterium]|jgi:hypothetical protein